MRVVLRLEDAGRPCHSLPKLVSPELCPQSFGYVSAATPSAGKVIDLDQQIFGQE
jgi:hypothetical protein